MRFLSHVKNYFLMNHHGMPCVRLGDEIVRRSDSFSTTGLSENRFGFVEDLNERTIAKSLIDGAHFTWTCSRLLGQVDLRQLNWRSRKRGLRQLRSATD
jgi:hypothetical protein